MNISIVMPSFNQREYLQQSIRTILDPMNSVTAELWVIDGGSTDGSVDLLRSIIDPRLKWLSEPDRGQTDALNKGFAKASGEIVGWLNSDDLYEPGALAVVAEAFAQHPEAQWLIGRCRIVDETGREVRRAVTRYKERRLRRYSYRRLLIENFICQPAVFWRRSFGQRIGSLDESLHYAMDYHLWLRMGAASEPLVLDRVLASFRHHRAAKTGAAPRRQFREQYQVACRYMKNARSLQWRHRLNIEKAYWGYRVLNLLRGGDA